MVFLKKLNAGAGAVVQRLKPLPVMPAAHMNTGSRPGCTTSIQLPADEPGRQQKMAQECLGACTHVGNLHGVQLGSDLSIVASGGVNQ